MPSWNIHTAHVERLLADCRQEDLGIGDANAFLFGNYVPDIYLGFMVPDVTFRINYRLTHVSAMSVIPVPDADRFWDEYVFSRTPEEPAKLSLVLGAWAHLEADRIYNARFRRFCSTHETPKGDELRLRKQGDFDWFGHSLGISSHVEATPELFEAAFDFVPYSVLRADVERTIGVADSIVLALKAASQESGQYQLLSEEWLHESFACCDDTVKRWLKAWRRLESRDERYDAGAIRAEADLGPAISDDSAWRIR